MSTALMHFQKPFSGIQNLEGITAFLPLSWMQNKDRISRLNSDWKSDFDRSIRTDGKLLRQSTYRCDLGHFPHAMVAFRIAMNHV